MVGSHTKIIHQETMNWAAGKDAPTKRCMPENLEISLLIIACISVSDPVNNNNTRVAFASGPK
jgi:hypothetical protein